MTKVCQRLCVTLLLISCCTLCGARSSMDSPATKSDSSGQNTLSVIPFQFTENGLGFGVAYERRMGDGKFAFYVPAMVTFNVANSNRIYDYNTGNYKTGRANAMFYTMPGVKFYPAGSGHKVSYAVGLAFAAGSGQKSENLVDLFGTNVTEQVLSHFILGGMLQQSVAVKVSPRVSAGLEFGVGSTFINNVGGASQGNEFLIQGGARIGYKFQGSNSKFQIPKGKFPIVNSRF